jgi:hypothetical protein
VVLRRNQDVGAVVALIAHELAYPLIAQEEPLAPAICGWLASLYLTWHCHLPPDPARTGIKNSTYGRKEKMKHS